MHIATVNKTANPKASATIRVLIENTFIISGKPSAKGK
jgi:hypothetical protein